MLTVKDLIRVYCSASDKEIWLFLCIQHFKITGVMTDIVIQGQRIL